MINALPKFLLIVLCSSIVTGCAALHISERAHDTIAHELLREEFNAIVSGSGVVPESELQIRIALLDKIIHESVKRIRASDADDKTREGVIKVFKIVDQVIIDNHFHLYIDTDNLWDTLTPGIPPPGAEGHRFIERRMLAHFELHPGATYYRFDCDTASFMYLAVFDKLQKPVVMVEVPGHNFVRWRKSAREHINWDVNDASSYSDETYRHGNGGNRKFHRSTELRGHFLKDMEKVEIRAYHAALVAKIYQKNGNLKRAIYAYKEAIGGRPYSDLPRNNLAWMIATKAKLQKQNYLDLALQMAKSAVALQADYNNTDTLAAVYAARREFDKAIEVEKKYNNSDDRIRAFEAKKTPVEMGWD